MLVFRKAQKEDIDKVANIYSDIHTCEETGLTDTGWVRDVYPTRETAKKAFERGDLFVAQDDSGVVGAAIINNQQMDSYIDASWQYPAQDLEVMVLHTLAISPKSSGKGYGKEFVAFYEKYAQDNNCKYLRMDTNARNTRARAMYKKLGYAEIDIVDCVFNGIEGVKLVLLEKKLI